MNGHHTPGTAINFLFWRICWICPLYISLFISYIRINIISWIHLFYFTWFGFYDLLFIKLRFSFVCFGYFVLCMSIHVNICILMYEPIIYLCLCVLIYFWCFVYVDIYIYVYFFFKLLLCEVHHFWWFMFIVSAYVCRLKFIFYFAFNLFTRPPKDGEIALWSATNRRYVVKCVSQKRIWSQKSQSYNI